MLQIGIIGAGRIGKVHTQSIVNYVRAAKVAAIADPFLSDETAQWAQNLGVGRVTKDYRSILNDPSIDAVLICSSTDTHAQISLEAIAAGKHIFCEKPIDHDVERIQQVLDALEKAPRLKYMVGFNRRFDHNFRAVRRAVEDGRIGKAEVIKVTSRDPEPPSAEYAARSGGIFLDMTIHDFDMVRYLSGSEVEEVYVLPGVLVDPAIGEAGDFDTAVISLKLKSGALAVIDNCRRCAYGYDQRAEVFGSLGAAMCGNDSESSAQVWSGGGTTGEKPLFFFLERYMQAYATEVTEFIEAVRNDTPVPVTARDGLAAVLIGIAATESAKTGRPVKINPLQIPPSEV
ncbi:MAG: inositol 2-dehydrogenase [Oscillospiraceae bacterium]|jgi:myo-inositol 2-dehydrogenase/D-chiro-inositol 1-dehydrogenase|nr:inositol 2-dehydrogenase [Oscillospiraceae bacterium]